MFLHPILLGVGLACVAVPVLIHFLMRRRRRPVRWAAMRFVQEAYRQQRRRLRLEQWLLLAARCLLIGLIAVGVARPMFGGAGLAGVGGAREVYLLVDTGIASAIDANGGEGSKELARSVEGALALLGELDASRGDRAALISLGGPAEGVVLPATADLALVERRLRELTPTDSGMDLAGGLRLVPEVNQEADSAPARVVAVYSGFREGGLAGLSGVGGASGLAGAELVVSPPADVVAGNVGLVRVEPLRPVVVIGSGGSGVVGVSQVRLLVARSGVGVDAAGETAVRLLAEDDGGLREVGVARVIWEAGQESAEVLADVDLGGVRVESGGGVSGRLVLRAELPADANERDNAAWAVVEVRERLRVAVVGTRRFGDRPRLSAFVASDWLKLALEPGVAASEIAVEVLDAARVGSGALAGFDAAIVAEPGRVRPEGWATLGAFSRRGGTVLFTASSTVGAQLWTEEAVRALDLPWTLGREPVEIAEGEGGLRPREAGTDDLLWYIRGELEGLARSVSVARLMDVRVEDAGEILLETSAGRPVLVVSRDDGGDAASRGLVAMLATAVDVDWTDLPARPLMVPIVQELVRAGVGADARGGAIVAGGLPSASGGAVEYVRWEGGGGDGAIVAVDAASGRTREPVRSAGVFLARDIEGATTGAMVVQPDAQAAMAGLSTRERVASALVGGEGADRLLSWSDGEGIAASEGEGAVARSDAPGPGLTLLLAALGLACVELWLARVASHAAAGGGGLPAGPLGRASS